MGVIVGVSGKWDTRHKLSAVVVWKDGLFASSVA